MSKAELRIVPAAVLEAQSFLLYGSGWDDCPAAIQPGDKPARIERVLHGCLVDHGVRPSDGRFVARIATHGMQPGHYLLTVARGDRLEEVSLEIQERRHRQERERGIELDSRSLAGSCPARPDLRIGLHVVRRRASGQSQHRLCGNQQAVQNNSGRRTLGGDFRRTVSTGG